ncbi:hypothetical protein HYS10_01060 [Candidatus Collierbacteria bacterium]|nr:hypothetical protein [Candidatus Collierbacteria bacterium]
MADHSKELIQEYGIGKLPAETISRIMSSSDQKTIPLSNSTRERLKEEAKQTGLEFLSAAIIEEPSSNIIILCLYYLGGKRIFEYQINYLSKDKRTMELELFRMLASKKVLNKLASESFFPDQEIHLSS